MRISAHPDSESFFRCGVAIICAGTLVSAIGSLMVRPAFQQTGYIAAVLVIATCLVVALSLVRLKHRRAAWRPIAIAYVAVSSAIVCYVTVSALQSSSSQIPVAGTLAGLLGLYWAASLMFFAFDYRTRTSKALGLCALAAANSSFSIVLATKSDPGVLGIVALSGCYVIFLGVQIYIAAVILHRDAIRQAAV